MSVASDTGRALDGLASSGGVAVYGNNLGSNTKGYAGDFFGRVQVTGDLVLNSGSGGGGIRVLGAGVGSDTPVFIHQATASNTSGSTTDLDNPLCNGDPNAILFVTQNLKVLGDRNRSVLEIDYNHDRRRWSIHTLDDADMVVGTYFNVLVVKP